MLEKEATTLKAKALSHIALPQLKKIVALDSHWLIFKYHLVVLLQICTINIEMNTANAPRCPEYNAALAALENDCLHSFKLYGFGDSLLSETQLTIKNIIADMLAIFEAKDTDYASNGKPMGNLRTSEDLGIPAWKGTLLRMGDKKQRIISFAQRGVFQVKDEQISDTLKDLANYACLASVLFREVNTGDEADEILEHFHMLALRSIHCKSLSECEEKGKAVLSWREQPLTELLEHFEAIAAYARKH